MHTCLLSCVQLCAIPWTVVLQAPLPGKKTGVGCHFLLQGILLTQGSNPCLPVSSALAGGFFTTEPPGKLEGKGICFNSMWSRNGCSCLFKIPSPPQLFSLITWSLLRHWAILLFYLSGHGDWFRDGLMTPVRAIRILRQTFSNWTGLFFSFGHWNF